MVDEENKKAYQAAYRAANKEKRKEYDKQRYAERRDEIVARATAWQKDNKEAHNAAVARYAERNPEVGSSAHKKYLDKNKGTVPFIQRSMVIRARKRAKQGGYPFDITVEDVAAVWPVDNKCPVFGFDFDLTGADIQRVASLDKIKPELGYVRGNIIVVSFRANSIKQDSTLDELRVLLEYYTGLLNP